MDCQPEGVGWTDDWKCRLSAGIAMAAPSGDFLVYQHGAVGHGAADGHFGLGWLHLDGHSSAQRGLETLNFGMGLDRHLFCVAVHAGQPDHAVRAAHLPHPGLDGWMGIVEFMGNWAELFGFRETCGGQVAQRSGSGCWIYHICGYLFPGVCLSSYLLGADDSGGSLALDAGQRARAGQPDDGYG